MTTSRAVTKVGLVLATIAAVLVTQHPHVAVWIANIGDWLAGVGLRLACYGY